MALLAALVLAVVAVALVAAPFLRPEPAPEPEADAFEGSVADLEHRKLEAYAAIRDAEMDFRMGKLSPADYETIKSKYTGQAIQALAALDHAEPAPASPPSGDAAPADSEIRFCPDCGTRRPDKARFCPSCGRGLRAAA